MTVIESLTARHASRELYREIVSLQRNNKISSSQAEAWLDELEIIGKYRRHVNSSEANLWHSVLEARRNPDD